MYQSKCKCNNYQSFKSPKNLWVSKNYMVGRSVGFFFSTPDEASCISIINLYLKQLGLHYLETIAEIVVGAKASSLDNLRNVTFYYCSYSILKLPRATRKYRVVDKLIKQTLDWSVELLLRRFGQFSHGRILQPHAIFAVQQLPKTC